MNYQQIKANVPQNYLKNTTHFSSTTSAILTFTALTVRIAACFCFTIIIIRVIIHQSASLLSIMGKYEKNATHLILADSRWGPQVRLKFFFSPSGQSSTCLSAQKTTGVNAVVLLPPSASSFPSRLPILDPDSTLLAVEEQRDPGGI